MTDLHHSSNLLLVMDCLWFNHAVLSSEPILTPTSKPTTPPPTISQSQTSLESESDLFSTPPPEEEHSDSSDSSPASPKDDSLGDDTEASEEGEPEYRYKRLRPTSLSLRTSPRRSRSHSSSPSLQSLTKTSSCKSLYELEYEEVKGFMDLGFKFKKDKLCPRMMSVLPGLQRLDEFKDGIEGLCDAMDEFKDNQIKEEIDGKEKAVARPYLSEAWLIRRPDSPLLNMRIPRISTSSPSEVKKHLKSWARTVATSIQLEY